MEGNCIEPWLFCIDPRVAKIAMDAGISHFVVDWERIGKSARQFGFDTEINADTQADLATMSGVDGAWLICRINCFGEWTRQEVEDAVALGAKTILLPMARSAAEIACVQSWVRGRVDFGVLLETSEACGAEAESIAGLGLDVVYVGLNDLAISRGSSSIFDAVADGTVARLREVFKDTPFGFGGLTSIDGGIPVPCRMLLDEMARLNCQFSFLRRSFRRDVPEASMASANEALQGAFKRSLMRSPEHRHHDAQTLQCLLKSNPVQSTLADQMLLSEAVLRVS